MYITYVYAYTYRYMGVYIYICNYVYTQHMYMIWVCLKVYHIFHFHHIAVFVGNDKVNMLLYGGDGGGTLRLMVYIDDVQHT